MWYIAGVSRKTDTGSLVTRSLVPAALQSFCNNLFWALCLNIYYVDFVLRKCSSETGNDFNIKDASEESEKMFSGFFGV